ncbi:MAG: hypothetical protein N2036_07415 [Bryobacteraceae bacterium]|nr:hypothetical protein [Bryobacteraceae bacterium]
MKTSFGASAPLALAWLCGLLCIQPLAADVRTVTQTGTFTIQPLGRLSVTSTVVLSRSGGPFTPYVATLPILYWARTTPAGTGTITVQASGDFTPAGGPSVAAGALTFTCSTDGYAVPCAGVQTVSSSVQRIVATVGGGACTGGGGGCSANEPASASATFSLANDPQTPTGAYSVTLVFTMSCT